MPFAALSFSRIPSIFLVSPIASPASPIVSFNTNPEFLAIPGSSKDGGGPAFRTPIDIPKFRARSSSLQASSPLKPCLKRRKHVKHVQEHRHGDSVSSLSTSQSQAPKRVRPTKIPRSVALQWSKQPLRPQNLELSSIGETEELTITIGTTMDVSRKWEHRHFALMGSEQWQSCPSSSRWEELSHSLRCVSSCEAGSLGSTCTDSSSSRRVRFADEVGGDLSQYQLLGEWFEDDGNDFVEPDPESSEFSDSDDDFIDISY